MAQDLPGAGEEPRPSCQGSALLDRNARQRPRKVLRIYQVVYKCGEDDFVGVRMSSAVVDSFVLEITTVYLLPDHSCGIHDRSHADPGYHGAATELR